MAAAAIAPLLLLLASPACSRSGAPEIELDGSPRHANAEGVVTAVSSRSLTLDGETTYDVSRDLRCFSAATRSAIPLASRKGTYVQLGVDGDTVEWLAGYGAVVEFPGRPPVAFHNGVLLSVEDGEATFEDGSVLRVASGVDTPPDGASVTAEIDVGRKAITRFTPQATVAPPAAP